MFYNAGGQPRDLFVLLKEMGLNMVRLRVWVHPKDGYNATADVVKKALRAKAAGLEVMIDFHYSDSWADPGQQHPPAAWASYTLSQMQAAVYAHTGQVLDTLKGAGIHPLYVQVGNEVSNGMLWPIGAISGSMQPFASLLDTGYAAVKSVDSAQKVIIHLNNGFNNGLFRWMFDSLTHYKVRYDAIGMSLYPAANRWQAYVDAAISNSKDMIARYKKPVFVVEAGMSSDSATQCKAFLQNLATQLSALPNHQGLGILYWEPQAYNWRNYRLGAWQPNGRPTGALEGLTE
jgi:arabinogalactan endo-1,4-beta-galactosidase